MLSVFQPPRRRLRPADDPVRDILAALWDGPGHGPAIAAAVAARAGTPPPPDAIDRHLRLLEAGGFITGRDVAGRRVYTIAERGSRMLADLSTR